MGKVGRPRKRLTRAQLEKARKALKDLTPEQFEMTTAIINFDISRKGAVYKAKCPEHGKKALSYLYVEGDGVYIFCERCSGDKRVKHFGKEVWEH